MADFPVVVAAVAAAAGGNPLAPVTYTRVSEKINGEPGKRYFVS